MVELIFSKVIIPLFVLLAVVLSVLIQPCLPAYARGTEVEYWAVIVGISNYKNIGDLLYSDDDAQDLYDQLAPIWGEDHIKLLVNIWATTAAIRNAICTWIDERADDNDVVLLFFAGHGDEYSGNYYIAPYNALSDSYDNDIRDDELDSWLDALEPETMVIILESCHSGGFIDDLSDTGRIILTSSSSGESSWQYRTLGHSVFSYYILEAFDNIEQVDTNGDYEISAEEFFFYAEREVVIYTQDKGILQHPKLDDGYIGKLGLFYEATFDTSPHITSLTIDGTAYSPGQLPVSFRWMPDSTHNFEISSIVSSGELGTQFAFTSWSDENSSPSRTISLGGEYTANYVKQYYLTVESEYGDPDGEGWYDEGTTASISVTSPMGIIIRQVCTGWSGDSTVTTPNATVHMDEPKTVTANWRNNYVQLYILIGGVLGLAGVITASVTRTKRKRRETLREGLDIGDKAAVPALIAALKDKHNYMRWGAAQALSEIGKAAVPALIKVLKDKDYYVRLKAAETLGEIGDEAAVPALVKLLNDEDSDVRSAAIEALKKISGDA
jgi:hypothetical protein